MLEITDLSKRYGPVVALDVASFTVRPGRLVGFLGPNGAGKTTTMRCVFGLAPFGPLAVEALMTRPAAGPDRR